MNERGKVTGITLGLMFPNNFREARYLSGASGQALFSSDEAVANVLAPVYNEARGSMQLTDLIDVFGETIAEITGNKDDIAITPDLIWRLWRTGNGEQLEPGWILGKPGNALEFPVFEELNGQSGRPRIMAAMIHILLPNGVRDCIVLEEGSFDSIYWSDSSVEGILAAAYPDSGMGVTADFVREIWRQPSSQGSLPAFLVRRPCGLISAPELETAVKTFRHAA